MSNQPVWLQQQLQSSASALLWAVEQHPHENFYVPPRPDRWSVARSVFHMVTYEQRLALPSLLQWDGGSQPIVGGEQEETVHEEQAWDGGSAHAMSALIADFNAVRTQQIEALSHLDEQGWHEGRDTVWGIRTLTWVVTKTYQHTLEHTNEILRAYLWWGKYHPVSMTSTDAQ